MDTELEDKNRAIIPRWRDFRTTLALGELSVAGPQSTQPMLTAALLEDQFSDWNRKRTLSFATDLVSSAFLLGITEGIEEAANFVLHSQDSSPPNKRLARQAIDPDFCLEIKALDQEQVDSEHLIDAAKANIHRHRERLRENLRNPITLVELSREFATIGAIEKAVRMMDMAVSLAPANRYVLRSATRLYVHAQRLEKAHRVLRDAPSLRDDPWLLAAEIAVATKRNLTSRHANRGFKKIADTNYSPFELSELLSAIGTLEMENASSRKARQLFRRSLEKPTDNSVAQAEWATRQLPNFSVVLPESEVPFNFEALAWDHYRKGDIRSATTFGRRWILDQPFSVDPVAFTAVAANLEEDFVQALNVLEFGLRANPDNLTLRNNLAFTLASDNQPIAAEQELAKIDRSNLTTEEEIVLSATEGLINFRKGSFDIGRRLYRRSIELAKNTKSDSYLMKALIFLAREEIHARSTSAAMMLEQAIRESSRFPSSIEMKILVDRLKKRLDENE